MTGTTDSEIERKSLVVTGASGFIGKAFLAAAKERYHIYALARRSQGEAGVPEHPDIDWYMVDIVDLPRLGEVFDAIAEDGGADFLVHLAGYYSFENVDEPEYERTNVQGTKNVLDLSGDLGLRRFVFASSLVVSEFPRSGQAVTEKSPPDATFPYARSKKKGEELVREHSGAFPCSVVRMAATFSDWCEYGPFYVLLSTWLGRGWTSRILAGKGLAAQPFVHIDHVVAFFLELLERTDSLADFDIYTVSSDEIYSHRELFEIATRLCFGQAKRPVLLPKPLVAVALVVRDLWGRMIGRRPFERPWMLRYVDRQLRADTRYTRAAVPVPFKPRLSLERRFPYMLENLSSYPGEWHARNRAVLKDKAKRPHLALSSLMVSRRQEIQEKITRRLLDPSRARDFPRYQSMDTRKLQWFVELSYNLLMTSVQHRDRISLISFARYLAGVRKREGFELREVKEALAVAGKTLMEELRDVAGLPDLEQTLADSVGLTLELAMDEIEAVYETEEEIDLVGDYHVLKEENWSSIDKNRFLQSVIDSIDDSIMVIDESFRIRMMNRHAHELHLGLEPALSPVHCYELAHQKSEPCSGDDHPCPLREVLRTKEAARVTHIHLDRHGREYEVAILASPLLDEEERIVGVIETTYRLPAPGDKE